MPAWEDLEGNRTKANHPTQTSVQHPRPAKKQKKNKVVQQKDDTLEKVRLADGRTAYVLRCFTGPDPFQESGHPNASYFVGGGEKQEEEPEQLRDEPKDQGEKLGKVNVTAQGEEPKPIFISTSLSEDMKEQVL